MYTRICKGDIVQHFKRETLTKKELFENPNMFLYEVKGFATNTETKEEMVIYQGLYEPFQVFARPEEMFMSKVDKVKYPDIKQEYRLEVVSILDKVSKSIRWCNATTMNYPTKLIIGSNCWERITKEVHNHLVMGLTHYPDGSHTKLFDIPVTIDNEQPEIMEICCGEVKRVEDLLEDLENSKKRNKNKSV